MSALINCTPHDVHVYSKDGTLLKTIPKRETYLRCTASEPAKERAVLEYDGISIPIIDPTHFDGLVFTDSKETKLTPFDPRDSAVGKIMIVSGIVAEYVFKYYDQSISQCFIVPDTDTSSVVRDEKGAIRGVKKFYSYYQYR